MDFELTEQQKGQVIVKAFKFINDIFTEESILKLANLQTGFEKQEQVYQSMIYHLTTPQLFAVAELLARMQIYIDADATALKNTKSALYPKTKTNIDFTLKLIWKDKIRAVLEKNRIKQRQKKRATDDHDDSNPYLEFFASVSELLQVVNSRFPC